METILLVGLGSAVGGICRYLLSMTVHAFLGKSFPYGTLTVNALGSFLIGFLFILLLDRYASFAEELRALLVIGFLGGFTTFSSFSMETINLFENGEIMLAGLNIFLSITICLVLTWLAVLLGRQL